MKRFAKITLVAVGLLALVQAASAQRRGLPVPGPAPSAQHPKITVAPRDLDPRQATSGPLSYVLSPTPDYTATMFGVLDVGMGKFYPISTTPTIGLGIGKDARSRLYFQDLNGDLYRINPGNGKVTKVGATGIS